MMDRESETDDERMYQNRPELDMDADNSVPQYLTNDFSMTSKCQCQQTLSGPAQRQWAVSERHWSDFCLYPLNGSITFLDPLRITGMSPFTVLSRTLSEWVQVRKLSESEGVEGKRERSSPWWWSGTGGLNIIWDWWMVVNRKSHFDCLITTLSPMRGTLMLKGLLLCLTWLMYQFANIDTTTSALKGVVHYQGIPGD